MQKVGTDDAGFSVEVDAATRSAKIVGWGFWDAEVAAAFDTTVLEAFRNASLGTNVSIDMSELKPMRDEGQRSFGHVLAELHRQTTGVISVTTTSHLVKLQLLRIARDAAAKERVQFT